LSSVEQEARRADAGGAAADKQAPPRAGSKRVEAPVFTQRVRNLQRRLLAARDKGSRPRAKGKI
jgi:hypothetical protein